MITPSFSTALAELGGGTLESQATAALSAIVRALTDHDRARVKGALRIDLKLERARGSGQLLITHTLTYTQPTATGTLTEVASDDTLVYASPSGGLSVIPYSQIPFDFANPPAQAVTP